jgi:hypothetical protein
VIKFVSDLQQVSGFLRVLQFSPTIKPITGPLFRIKFLHFCDACIAKLIYKNLASTIKFKLSMLVFYEADIVIILSKCNILFSPNNNHLKLFKISGKLFVTYTMVLMIYVMFSTKIPLVPVKNTAVMANSCLRNNKLFFIQIVHE